MRLSRTDPRAPLIEGISQFEVDFVMPRLGVDLPLGIDPFLLFKSRDLAFSRLHSIIVDAFNAAVVALHNGDLSTAEYLFDFPEVAEIGLGYTERGKRGSGVGDHLSQLIMSTLMDSPALMERGVRHIEEMQLVSVGIAADRTSDIAANLIKQFLIEYSQKQCALWEIPLQSGVPVNRVFDPERFEWYDGYFDLPTSSIDGTPIILVPRRIVRTLPWINYDDYFRLEFAAYLRAKHVRKRLSKGQHENQSYLHKEQVASVTRSEIERIDRYVERKETTASQAQPSQNYVIDSEICPEAERLKKRLRAIVPGTVQAAEYERTVLEILNYLFSPELIDGQMEVKTVDGTERRDIVFTNDSDESFWTYVRQEHSGFLVMFETKNASGLEPSNYNQVNTYLGDRLGRLGFIVTRHSTSLENQRKAFSIYNDSHPRRIILTLSDLDLLEMIDMKCRGQTPTRFVQKVYRRFRQTAQ